MKRKATPEQREARLKEVKAIYGANAQVVEPYKPNRAQRRRQEAAAKMQEKALAKNKSTTKAKGNQGAVQGRDEAGDDQANAEAEARRQQAEDSGVRYGDHGAEEASEQ